MAMHRLMCCFVWVRFAGVAALRAALPKAAMTTVAFNRDDSQIPVDANKSSGSMFEDVVRDTLGFDRNDSAIVRNLTRTSDKLDDDGKRGDEHERDDQGDEDDSDVSDQRDVNDPNGHQEKPWSNFAKISSMDSTNATESEMPFMSTLWRRMHAHNVGFNHFSFSAPSANLGMNFLQGVRANDERAFAHEANLTLETNDGTETGSNCKNGSTQTAALTANKGIHNVGVNSFRFTAPQANLGINFMQGVA